ncbi:MAG: hypothetical protein AAF639_41645 [Chloroflexota bacterium]
MPLKPEQTAKLAGMLRSRSTYEHEIGSYKSLPAIFEATMGWLERVV